MYKICLQAGHQNIKFNSIVALHGATGAPQEVDFNIKTRNRLAEILRAKNIEVVTTDANANDDPSITQTDFDLFLSCHYDADVYGDSGGFVDRCDPNLDGAADRSLKALQKIQDVYFSRTGIKNMYQRRNINTSQYYMWRYLSQNTPCVIIECGVGQRKPNDYEVLFNQNEKVCQAIAEGIFNYLGVSTQPVPPSDPCISYKTQIEQLNTTISTLYREIANKENDIVALKRQIGTCTLSLQVPNQKLSAIAAYIDTCKWWVCSVRTIKKLLNI